jgi:hypothetical protein
MGGGKGKKDVNAKLTTNFINRLKYKQTTFKTKSTDSFAKSTVSDAKPTITDAKPTVIH